MHDEHGNAIVIQLDTPKVYRGLGYARKLLAQIHMQETSGNLMVFANAHAAPYYEKLGYTEVAPYVFQA
jgi:histone acetyltransferase (RNA polymerase elongator complex component)